MESSQIWRNISKDYNYCFKCYDVTIPCCEWKKILEEKSPLVYYPLLFSYSQFLPFQNSETPVSCLCLVLKIALCPQTVFPLPFLYASDVFDWKLDTYGIISGVNIFYAWKWARILQHQGRSLLWIVSHLPCKNFAQLLKDVSKLMSNTLFMVPQVSRSPTSLYSALILSLKVPTLTRHQLNVFDNIFPRRTNAHILFLLGSACLSPVFD